MTETISTFAMGQLVTIRHAQYGDRAAMVTSPDRPWSPTVEVRDFGGGYAHDYTPDSNGRYSTGAGWWIVA